MPVPETFNANRKSKISRPLGPNEFILFLPEIKEFIDNKDFTSPKDLLKSIHSIDIAEGWVRLEPQEKIIIFQLLTSKKAVEVFNEEKIDLVLHAGDYVSPFSLKPFFSLKCNFLGVWGNNDGDKIALKKTGLERIVNSTWIESIDGKTILLGHYFETLEALIASRQFFLIVYGHTHKAEVRKEGITLVVNPGECGGWVNGKSTIAVVDLEKQTARIIEL